VSATRVAFVLGIAALFGACRDKSTGSQGSGTQSGSGGRAAIAAPTAPSLPQPAPAPALPASSGAPEPSQVFAAQQRDPAWADATERELAKRIPALASAKLLATECRRDQCMLELGGSDQDVAAILARLESPTKGITGYAKSLMLTAPEQRDGKTVIRAYAQFER